MKHLGISLLILAGLAAGGCHQPKAPSEPPAETAALPGKGPEVSTPPAAPESEAPSPSTDQGQASEAKSPGKPEKAPVKKFPHIHNPVVAIEGDKGTIYIELRPDKAPKSSANFLKLVKKGFYDGLRWHRREEGFVIQGGDPLSKRPDWQSQPLGSGDVGYTVEGEFGLPHERGTVAMARTGDEVNPERRSSGCQFYICLQPAPFLDGAYSAFGKVIQGLDVVDQIQIGDVMRKVYVVQEP